MALKDLNSLSALRILVQEKSHVNRSGFGFADGFTGPAQSSAVTTTRVMFIPTITTSE